MKAILWDKLPGAEEYTQIREFEVEMSEKRARNVTQHPKFGWCLHGTGERVFQLVDYTPPENSAQEEVAPRMEDTSARPFILERHGTSDRVAIPAAKMKELGEFLLIEEWKQVEGALLCPKDTLESIVKWAKKLPPKDPAIMPCFIVLFNASQDDSANTVFLRCEDVKHLSELFYGRRDA